MSPNRESLRIFQFFFPAMVLFSLYLAYMVASPFLHAIIMGIVFAVLSWPIQKKMLKLTKRKWKRIPATILTMLIIVVCVILPFAVFIARLIPQALGSLSSISEWLVNFNLNEFLDSQTVHNFFSLIKEHLPFINPETDDIGAALLDATRAASQFLLKGATTVVSNALTFAMHFALVLLVMFFMLLDGEDMMARFMYLFPLKEVQKDAIFDRLRAVAKAVLVGGVLVAILQGLVGAVGMAVVGMPVLFCGALMALASFVPVLGTGLVWVPVSVWLFINGMTWQGVFILIWCGGIVTTIDSVMRPLFMSNQAGLSTFFLFMSILGGLKAFGMLGIFYGPLILGFVVVMLSLYAKEYQSFLTNRSPSLKAEHAPPSEKSPETV
ncbi:MAG: AI-2E family transporter [Desulfovibrionaceae bacterium]|nr:AI-2E family transporter [Desulfovibrionaceae bacterium]